MHYFLQLLTWIVAIIGGGFLFYYLRNRPRLLYFSMYPSRGISYWPKYALLNPLLMWRRGCRRARNAAKGLLYDAEKGRKYRESEQMREVVENSDKVESVYFHGSDVPLPDQPHPNGAVSQGYGVALRLVRRPGMQEASTCEFWMVLRLPNGKLLTHPRAPLTAHLDYSVKKSSSDEHAKGDSASEDGMERWAVDAGCTLVCHAPMKRWRVKFTGFLKQEGSETLVHVDLDLTFRAYSHPIFTGEHASYSLLADALAREPLSRDILRQAHHLVKSQADNMEQWGDLDGRLSLDYGQEVKLHLKGNRQHFWGSKTTEEFYRRVTHHGVIEDGSCFTIGTVSYSKALRHWKFGYLVKPFGKICPITSHTFDLWQEGENYPPNRKYDFHFRADGKRYHVYVDAQSHVEFKTGEKGELQLAKRFAKYRINGRLAYGVNEFTYSANSDLPLKTHLPNFIATENERDNLLENVGRRRSTKISEKDQLDAAVTGDVPQCLPFSHPLCDTHLAGGKGRQLAFLTRAHSTVSVPTGFVISTTAYMNFIQSNEELMRLIEKQRTTHGTSYATTIQEMILQTELNNAIKENIIRAVETAFGDAWETVSLAVRSSATGEDSSSASAAGQMETHLGILGKEKILESVKKCWVSLYSSQAVEYRTQYGLSHTPTMAVVVQQLVNARKAGVIFTHDPQNGDSTQMVINANFGLGESIVSGECEPDTYLVTRYPNGTNKIRERIVGDKRVQTLFQEHAEVIHHASQGDEAQKLCLTDEEIQSVVDAALLIEQLFASPRDIEWAFDENGKLCILQARPITSLLLESDENLIHEFDSALAFDGEYLTTANIGEMMPLAVTPLTLSVFADAVEKSLQAGIYSAGGMGDEPPVVSRSLPTQCNHLFINIFMLSMASELFVLTMRFQMVFLALIGRVPERPTLEDLEYFSGKANFWRRFIGFIKTTRRRNSSEEKTRVWEKRLRDGYVVSPKATAREQIQAIDRQLNDYYQCWDDTIVNTSKSAVNSMIIMNILAGNKPWTNELYSQVALLLSSCEKVYSADVPSSLKKIALAIKKSKDCDKFLQMNDEECTRWVLSPESEEINAHFKEFLRMHGHRCVREAEFRETSWQAQPSKVVSVIKSMITSGSLDDSSGKSPATFISVEDAVNSLTIPLSPLKKRILKWLLPNARAGVGLREWGKSISIEMVDIFKEAYKRLGQLCVDENLMPDADLLYFFTHEELQVFLEHKGTNSPHQQYMLSKAQRRRKVLSDQMSCTFPEMQVGFRLPEEPTQTRESSVDDGNQMNRLKGMTVSRGTKKGVARVIKSLQDAKSIEKGDILIVPYTDVGWTPYFPIISGLVTEKGGLLSHGAVVAREFGLPCIVGAIGATSFFSTGDRVYLNSTEGYIERIL